MLNDLVLYGIGVLEFIDESGIILITDEIGEEVSASDRRVLCSK